MMLKLQETAEEVKQAESLTYTIHMTTKNIDGIQSCRGNKYIVFVTHATAMQ